MSTLGKRIKEARIKRGLTQRQLAEIIGVKHNSISDWENDKNKPYADMVELLLGALEIDANTLLGFHYSKEYYIDLVGMKAVANRAGTVSDIRNHFEAAGIKSVAV